MVENKCTHRRRSIDNVTYSTVYGTATLHSHADAANVLCAALAQGPSKAPPQVVGGLSERQGGASYTAGMVGGSKHNTYDSTDGSNSSSKQQQAARSVLVHRLRSNDELLSMALKAREQICDAAVHLL